MGPLNRVEGVQWIHLTWDGDLVGSCECSNEPLCPIKCREFLD
jgi:hypothetical protein